VWGPNLSTTQRGNIEIGKKSPSKTYSLNLRGILMEGGSVQEIRESIVLGGGVGDP